VEAAEIHKLVSERFGDKIVGFEPEATDAWIDVRPDAIRDVGRFLKEEPRLAFDALWCLSGVDEGERLATVYHLQSLKYRHRIVLKARAPREAPHTASVADVWRTAEWHEREAYDLIGILYDGHPYLRRILTASDWEGHPLRKDYVQPDYYHGIPHAKETFEREGEAHRQEVRRMYGKEPA
jgi:NADH-quinone oxidoreductase subunit C